MPLSGKDHGSQSHRGRGQDRGNEYQTVGDTNDDGKQISDISLIASIAGNAGSRPKQPYRAPDSEVFAAIGLNSGLSRLQ